MVSAQRMLSSLLAGLMLAAATPAHGVGGTDNAGCYAFSDTLAPLDGNAPTYAFSDISGSGTAISLSDDSVSSPIPIGFTFNFYGTGYADVHVSSNGFLTFLSGQSSGCCSGQPIPSTGSPDAIVAGWWEDLLPGSGGGTIHYETLGSTPNQVFVVQFTSIDHYAGGTPVTFEFKLFETSHSIEVHYQSALTDGGTHSAGIEDQSGLKGAQWQFGSAISFSTTAVRYFADVGLSSDGDSDGVADCIDNCPATANPGQEDGDTDGIGNACDPCVGPGADADGDGFCDGVDNCPAAANPGQEDSDFDGYGDVCDSCVGPGPSDSDGDGPCDPVDNCPTDPNPGQEDGDGDGIGDVCDPCAQDPSSFDFDGDGFCSDSGVCPAGCDNCYFTFNPDQADGDADGRGDLCDNCPADANPGQQDSDFDGYGDSCDACVGPGPTDSDGDGACDSADNCPTDPNPGQDDGDGDGIGDVCDPCLEDPSFFDFDGDGFCSDSGICPAGCDNCFVTFNPDQANSDTDGLGDLCDNCPANPNSGQEDSDSDGFGDVCDACVGPGIIDSDGDGLCDSADPCVNDPTQACATLFGCTGTGNSASNLYRINPTNGVAALVGPMGIFGCGGLALHPATAVLYAVGRDADLFQESLFTVDPETGAATLVGATGQSSTADIAFRDDGTLFSYHPSSTVGTMSTSTGTVTVLGSSAVGGGGNGIAFDGAGDLLHANSSALNILSETTGSATQLAPLTFPPVSCSFPRINAMDLAPSDTVYGVLNCSGGSNAPNYLVTIGVPSGSVAAIAPSVPGLDGIAFEPGICGDGLARFGEECDDGNTLNGDCCSSLCESEAAGGPCPDDGSPCTVEACDGDGTCVSAPPTTCKTPGKSILLIKNNANDPKDKLVWKWLKGPATVLTELGDPQATADYALCLYTGVLQAPLTSLTVPANAMKWGTIGSKGYKYKDPAGAAQGVTGIQLKGGGAGKTKVLVKGKGGGLPDPNFVNLPLPVTAQLVNSETATCFQTTFTTADVSRNDQGQFRAKK